MKTPRTILIWFCGSLLIGAVFLFTRGHAFVNAQGDTISITGADFSRTMQPADSSVLRDNLMKVVAYIVLQSADKQLTLSLAYPLGKLGDTQPPVLTDPKISTPNGGQTFTVGLTTDEYAQVKLDYGVQSGVYTQTVTNLLYEKSHQLALPDLTKDQRYYYTVTSTDRDGNVGTTPEATFVASGAAEIFLPLVRR